jgi:acyl carrier protein
MNREGIKQRVMDALGVILVDKDAIQEDATFQDLVLDNEDVDELFNALGTEFGFEFPESIRQRAIHKPEHLSLPMIVDLVLLMQQELDPGVTSGRRANWEDNHGS